VVCRQKRGEVFWDMIAAALVPYAPGNKLALRHQQVTYRYLSQAYGIRLRSCSRAKMCGRQRQLPMIRLRLWVIRRATSEVTRRPWRSVTAVSFFRYQQTQSFFDPRTFLLSRTNIRGSFFYEMLRCYTSMVTTYNHFPHGSTSKKERLFSSE
jgi:hypothetical protein